jgi:hypothetical protein
MRLARMLNAHEYFQQEKQTKEFVHLDYMDFAERYADYVVGHEKFIDATSLAAVEKLENDILRFGPEEAYAR